MKQADAREICLQSALKLQLQLYPADICSNLFRGANGPDNQPISRRLYTTTKSILGLLKYHLLNEV